MNYQLDIQAARQADLTGRITDTGAYVGVFTKAKEVVSTKGTKGIEFTFKDEFGNTADFLSLWTIKESGEQIFGYRHLMSLMTCLKLKSIVSERGQVEEYDTLARQVVKATAAIYPDLMHKKIGVLLQSEEYRAKSGEVKRRVTIAGFFDAHTRLVAREILEKKTLPELLQKRIDQMPPVKKLLADDRSSSGRSDTANIDDDDIPF